LFCNETIFELERERFNDSKKSLFFKDSFALKPGEDLDVELKKAKLEYFRMQVFFFSLIKNSF